MTAPRSSTPRHRPRPPAVALLLDLGFSPGDRNGLGEQPLHTAAYHGNAEVVRLLIDAGAELDARDARFDGTPLAYATVGSGERAGRPGNWAETVRLLIEAGACPRRRVGLGQAAQRRGHRPAARVRHRPRRRGRA